MATLADLMVRIGVDAEQVNRDLGKVDGFFQRHAAKMEAAGAALGAAAGAAIGAGISTALEKERLGDKLAAQLGATGEEAARLGQVTGDLYSQGLGESMQQVNDAVGAVVSSIEGMRGASAESIEDVSKRVLNLATAFEVDVARAAQVAGQIVKSGLVKDVDQGLDLITATMQKVPAAVREDLLDALDEYAPFMNQIGVTGQKAFNLLLQAADKGAFGLDKTGDALKEFSLLATDMSESTQEAYKTLGMSAEKMTADLLAGGTRGEQAFQKIVSGLLSIKDPVEQSQTALALFGTPLEDLSTQDIPKFLATLDTTKNTLGDVSGAADRLGQTLNDNAATGIESWTRRTEEALGSLANAPGIMGETAQAAAGIGQVLLPIGSDLGGLAAAAFVGAQAFGPLARAAATAAVAVGSAAKTMVVSAASATASMAATAARVVAGWVMMGVQALLGAARVALAWLIAMGPIALVIAAVIGLVVVVVKYWDQIKDAIAAAWEWIKGKTAAVWDWLRNAIGQAIDFLVNLFLNWTGPGLLIKHWDKIRSATQAVWNWVVARVRGAIDGVLAAVGWLRALPGRVAGFFGRMRDAAVERAQRLVTWVRGLPGRISGALGNLGRLLIDKGKAVVQGLWSGIQSMGSWIYNKILGWAKSMIPGPIAKALGIKSPSKVTREQGKWIARGLIEGLTGEQDKIKSAAQKAADLIKKVLGDKKDKGLRDRLLDSLQDSTKRLQGLAKQREKVLKKIAQMDEFRKSVVDSAKSFASLTSIDYGEGGPTASGIKSGLQGKLAQLRQFAEHIKELIKRGVPRGLLRQILEAGPEAGAPLAEALATSDASTLGAISSAQREIDKISKQLGSIGIDAAFGKGAYEGLLREQHRIEQLMGKIAQTFARQLAAALGAGTGGLARGNSAKDNVARGSSKGDLVRGVSKVAPAPTVLEIRGDETRVGTLLVEVLRKAVAVKGGNVQQVIGKGK